jgi:hypothetical protein
MDNFQNIQRRYLAWYLLFYYGFLAFNYLHERTLHQFQALYFTYNRDLFELGIIATGLPKFLIDHPNNFFILDIIAFSLPIPVVLYYLRFKKFQPVLGILFSGYLLFYFLLMNIFMQIHLESYAAYLLLSFIFWLNNEASFYKIVKLVRLLFLYVFFSAALWKIIRGSVFYPAHMQQLLVMQHASYLSEDCQTWYCSLYHFLIEHPLLSQSLYILATILELIFVIGWLTKKYDYLLLILALFFFAADHILMLIPYWQIMISGITLLTFIHSEKWQKAHPIFKDK